MRNRVVTKRHDLKITDFRENPGGNKPGLGVQLGSKVKRVQLNKGRLYAINYDKNLQHKFEFALPVLALYFERDQYLIFAKLFKNYMKKLCLTLITIIKSRTNFNTLKIISANIESVRDTRLSSHKKLWK